MSKWRGSFGLVRDRHGNPKFNDIFDIPDPIWNMLTSAEKRKIENDRISQRSAKK